MLQLRKRIGVVLMALAIGFSSSVVAIGGDIALTLRSRTLGAETSSFERVEWDPQKTVLIVCDMWDAHWCASATRRVAEMAGPLNETIKAARAEGVFIIYAPSLVTGFYEETPQRDLGSVWEIKGEIISI